MVKRKTIALLVILIILLQLFMPIFNQSYATDDFETVIETENSIVGNEDNNIDETSENQEIIDETEENDENNNDNTTDNEKETIEENEDKSENTDENEIDDDDNNEDIELNTLNDDEEIEEAEDEKDEEEEELEIEPLLGVQMADMPLVGSASGGGANAGSEGEFSGLFYNTGVGELTIQNSIRLNSTYTVNHSLRIDSSSQSGANSLQLSSGCSIIVPNGCVLTLDEVVIDGRSFGNNDGKSCITVQNGGVLMLTGHSIIDGGTKNWGINVESGGQLLVESGQICYCNRGIVVQGSSYCDLGSSTVVQWWGNTGKTVDIIDNSVGIYVGGAYRGTLVVNHISGNGEKINFERNTYAIESEGHSGSITVKKARMVSNGWAIYTHGTMTIEDVNGAYNARGIVSDGATVYFKGGSFYSDGSNLKEYGVYNLNGTVYMQGGNVYNDTVGIWNSGTIHMSAGNVGSSTTGIENHGTVNLSGGRISSGTYGINNSGNVNMTGGTITGFAWGVKNPATFNISGGSITGNSTYGIVNEASSSITGQLYITGGNVTGNTSYDIYHGKSDTDGAGAVYGGLRIERNDTVSGKILLAAYNNYIYTGSTSPTLSNVTLGDVHLERHVIRTASNSNTTTMAGKVTVNNKGSYYLKANGSGHSGYVALWTNYTVTTYHKTEGGTTLGSSTQTIAYKDSYSTSSSTFEGYVLKTTPTNASGTVTGNISVTYIYEEDKNVAVVNFEDLVSGVVSAKYWYNSSSQSFSGNGTNFSNGTVFENYGYYKVVVTNGVGLQKELTFVLDKNSV